ncbi:MAG TPA: IclR family transcriptional regulator [Gaiellaceae bacterium]|nr:IclR family transcriptional regulator [Gaiellaceae bacterium]
MQSADKALAILAAFEEGRPAVGVSELAGELGLHKSTVSRLLATLENRALVRREGERFTPGPELARLGALAMRALPLVDVARRPMARLAEKTGETVNLAVRRGERALNVHQVDTTHLVGVTDWTGRALPLHATANGKVLLAFGDDRLPRSLPKLAQKTITDRRRLAAELEHARRAGFAVATEELELGLHAVAAPVFDGAGTCVAAISVSAPAYRLPERRLPDVAELCVAAAAEVSARLGHRRAA